MLSFNAILTGAAVCAYQVLHVCHLINYSISPMLLKIGSDADPGNSDPSRDVLTIEFLKRVDLRREAHIFPSKIFNETYMMLKAMRRGAQKCSSGFFFREKVSQGNPM